MPIPGLSFTDEQIFNSVNLILPCWVLLILLPHHKLTHALCTLVSFFLCVVYTALVGPKLWSGAVDFMDFSTMQGVVKLFKNPEVVVLGWVHYGAADLWVGHWIALDGWRRNMPRLLMAPILVAAMLLGPMGLGLFFIVRTWFKPVATKSKQN